MSNEITVRITCSLEELYNILENKGFSIVDKYFLNDTYYINSDIDIQKQLSSEIFKKYILIRNIIQFIPNEFIDNYNILKMTLKMKNIESDGTIINQDKIDCQIQDKEQGINFIEALGYKKLMIINEKSVVYEKDGLMLDIKEVEENEKLIEIETVSDNSELDTIEKLKDKINKLHIPINTNDYFVKKAEIGLKKII